MKKVQKKISKKTNQRIKKMVIATGLLICCCIVFISLISMRNGKNEIYKIDSKVKDIEKEKKIDKKGYETIGWLKVQGTNIDAPIVSYEDAEAFDSIDKNNFLWNQNDNEKFYNQVTIMGHNILNLSKNPEIGLDYFSRFDDLMGFVYEDFITENKYIQYTVNGENYLYKIFGVFFEKRYNLDLISEENYSKETMNTYITQVKEKSIYDFDIEVDENDSVIKLVTCTRFFGVGNSMQFVVTGRLLRENEKVENYDVTTNENYKEIEDIMKGDEQDEKEQI